MGCINNPRKITIHSVKSLKKESKTKLDQIKNEYIINEVFNFSDEENDEISNYCYNQSPIPVKTKIENNEYIFV